MAKFTLVDNKTEVDKARMHLDGERDSKRLRLHGVGADKKVLHISSTDDKVVSAILQALFDGPKGIWTVDLRAKAKGQASVEVRLKAAPPVAKVAVTVVDKLALPGATTETGLLVRLFLAENLAPGQKGYTASDSKKSMQWMRLVLVNRLKNKPAQFGAPNAKTITDIVKAKGQFAGFEKYPALEAKLTSRIREIEKIANDDGDARQENYLQFFQDALDVAKAQLIHDPCSTGLYGWRTVDSSSPGGSFVTYSTPLSGNQFYTLKQK
jgi:hypothetical protein